jgi:4-hydroxy-tetrahydrodipicolinate synthase
MSSALDLHGVYLPLITPFTKDGGVAYDEIERLAHKGIDDGVAGIVALGTTGEPATLDAEERRRVVEIVGAVCRERSARFCVGAGTNSTSAALELTNEAIAAGAQSVLSVVPYYTRPSEAGIVEHFKSLAVASSVPLIVYNIPYRTGRGLGADSLLELARTPNIAGLKQAVGGIDADTERLLAEKPDDFHVLCGDDPFIFPMIALGADGAITASAHVCTSAFVSMVDSALKGDYVGARETHEALLPVCTALFTEPSPSVIKGVLASSGAISSDELRLPMTAASSTAVQHATEIVETAKARLTR